MTTARARARRGDSKRLLLGSDPSMATERGSDKHGPRLDDELQEEFEPEERGGPTIGRVEPHREIEEVPGEDPE